MCSGVGGTTRSHLYRERYARRLSEPFGSGPRKRTSATPTRHPADTLATTLPERAGQYDRGTLKARSVVFLPDTPDNIQ